MFLKQASNPETWLFPEDDTPEPVRHCQPVREPILGALLQEELALWLEMRDSKARAQENEEETIRMVDRFLRSCCEGAVVELYALHDKKMALTFMQDHVNALVMAWNGLDDTCRGAMRSFFQFAGFDTESQDSIWAQAATLPRLTSWDLDNRIKNQAILRPFVDWLNRAGGRPLSPEEFKSLVSSLDGLVQNRKGLFGEGDHDDPLVAMLQGRSTEQDQTQFVWSDLDAPQGR